MLKRLAFLAIGAASLAAPVQAADSTRLGADGFPADWKAEDFQVVSSTSGMSAAAVSASVPQPVSGAAVYRVDQLPRVKSDVVQPIENKHVNAEKAANEAAARAARVTLPKVEEEDAGGAQPKTLNELNNYGPLSAKIGSEVLFNGPIQSGAQGVRKGSAGDARMSVNGAQLSYFVENGRRNVAAWTLNDAFRRTLLTRGPAPKAAVAASVTSDTVGVSGSVVSGTAAVTPTAPVVNATPWLAARARALEALGFNEAADGLWRAVGPDLRLADPALAEGWVSSRLLAGQTGEACQLAANQVLNSGGGEAGAFWKQVVLACQAIAGQREALGLSLQLAESATPKADPFLLAVATAVREDRAVDEKVKAPGRIGILAASVLATYPALIAEEWLPKLPDVVWRRLVRTEGLPWRLRTAAAELLAAQTHANADVEVVQAFYAVSSIEGVDFTDPLGAAEKVLNAGEPVRARAMLWQAANGRAGGMGLRALCWQRWAMRASVAGLGGLLPVMSPDTARIKPAPELAWLAPVAQSLVWQRGETGTDWLRGLQQNGSVAPALKIEAQWLAVQAGLMSGTVDKAAWETWLAQPEWSAAERLRAARMLSSASALGVALPSDLLPLLQQKVGEFDESVGGARPLWVQAVDSAVTAKQAGTALDLLHQLAPGEDPLSPPLLVVQVNALHDLGLVNEAREVVAAALMAPLLSENSEPPAPKITGGKRPEEKVKKVGEGTLKLAPVPVSPSRPVRTQVTPDANDKMTPGGILMPPLKH
ncbi:MAG TPA: hypothetical protein VHP58_05775 [Alphaproteobacteria bacterium]|nr:hypothetical protein [Alphaproteobacteria bacterium]